MCHIKIGQRISSKDLKKVEDLLRKSSSCVINCDTEGGDFLIALKIYQTLKLRPTQTVINRVCKSAGVVIWLAGFERRVKKGAWMFLHDVHPRSHPAGQVLREILVSEGFNPEYLRGGIALTDVEIVSTFNAQLITEDYS